jgi:beta-glucosidase
MKPAHAALVGVAICALIVATDGTRGKAVTPAQPELERRSISLLEVDGLKFKDLARTGKLEPYEDWRLPAEDRADDLAKRLSLEDATGLMVHGTLPSHRTLAALGTRQEYDLEKARWLIHDQHVTHFITRLNAKPEVFAC